jgi:TP901 family phage tail tape measure protein
MSGDRILTVKLAGDSKGATKAIGSVEGKAVGLGKKLLKIGGVFAGLSFGKNLIGDIASVGMEYQKTMNVLQSVTGATDKQMKRAGQTARDLGSDITIPGTSASQAAGAMLELSKGGLSMGESMQAARGSLMLAAAAGIDGARAAEIQAASIAQFNLKGRDAGMVADTLANVADSAAGSIDDVALALSYVGPVAGSVSMTIGETGAAIGLLHKNAILGNKAGTSLRAVIAGLANPSVKAGKALDKLGVVAFDNQGKFVGMRKITDQLSKAKERLTEEEFAAAGAAAFGREPLAAINTLANEGVKGWDKMAKSVEKEGTAAKTAAAKNKGFGGAVDGLHGQLEDLYITIWEKAAPGLERIVDALSSGVGKFTDWINGPKDMAKSLNNIDGEAMGKSIKGAVDKALSAVSGLAGSFSKKIGKMFKNVDWVGLGIELGKMAVPLVVGLGLGILNFDLGALLKGLADNWQAVLFGILTIMFMPAKWAAKIAGLLRRIPFVGKFLGWLVESINKVGGKLKGLFGKFFKSFGSAFKEALGWTGPGLIIRLVGLFMKMRGKILEWGLKLGGRMASAAQQMGSRFGNWLARHGPVQALNAIRKIKERIFAFFAPAGNWLIRHGTNIIQGLTQGARNWMGTLLGWIRGIKGKVTGVFGNAGSWLLGAGAAIISGLISGIWNKVGELRGLLNKVTKWIPDWKGPADKDAVLLTPAGESVMDGFNKGLASRFGGIRKSLGKFTKDIANGTVAGVQNLASGGQGAGLTASAASGGTLPRRSLARASTGQNVTVIVKVAGNVIGEKDFAKRVTPTVRDELKKIGDRNSGRIFG